MVAAGLVTLGCGSPAPPADQATSPTTDGAPSPGETTTSSCVPAPLDVRAARVLVVGLPGATESSDAKVDEILDVGVGGVLITSPNVDSSEQVSQFVSDVRALSDHPLVITAGEESGRVATFRDVLGATPSARSLAAKNTPGEVQEIAAEVGSGLAALGIDLDLAPVVDLDDGPSSGIIGDRSFSADPDTTAEYGLAWAQGLASAGVAPTAKHFPGHGRVTGDSHIELATVDASLEELQASDLVPFAELIDAGTPVVMLDHIAYTAFDSDLPASLAPKAYQLLRDMGFEGVAITDSVGMGAVNLLWSFPEAAVLSVTAGADAVLTTDGSQARAMRDALVAAVEAGELPEDRLNEAAARMATLAGDDAEALTCRTVDLPELDTDPGN